jgi:ribosomal protein S18 acetylase RimI-like enzyme
MHNAKSWFKRGAFLMVAIGIGSIITYQYIPCQQKQDYYVYEFNDDERDIRDVEQTFKDDFYWLTTRDSYDVRAMLTRRTSEFCDPAINNNMSIYIMRDKATDAFVGFVTFFRLSFYKGQILFVSVNKAFQGKGYGQKLTEFALERMKKMGMIKATLFTRLNNTKARKLYERVGFKESSRAGDIGLYYDIYLD